MLLINTKKQNKTKQKRPHTINYLLYFLINNERQEIILYTKSEYDLEILHSQTADQPMTQRGIATGHLQYQDSQTKIKAKQQALYLS